MSCFRENPLVREGTSQTGRALPALDPASAPLDERTTADFLRFARRYGAHLRYVDGDNRPAGDWASFWSADPSVAVARLADLGVEPARHFLTRLGQKIMNPAKRDDDQFLLAHFNLLFVVPLALVQECNAALDTLPPDDRTRQWGKAQLSRADGPLRTLAAYYKGAGTAFATPAPTVTPLPFPPADFGRASFEPDPRDPRDPPNPPLADAIALTDRVREWLEASPFTAGRVLTEAVGSWSALLASVRADGAPYSEEATVYGQLYDALHYNLFVRAYTGVLEVVGRISAGARRVLDAEPADTPDHQPHYALWLTFLRLFEGSRTQLNALPGRHLQHYYREVLHLRTLRAQPNAAHLLFALKRGATELFLPTGTTFRAGKDATGAAVEYELTQDLIVNRASVAAVRSVYASPEGIRARTEALEGTSGPWQDGDTARVGFALSDPRLLVRGGVRTFTLSFGRRLTSRPNLQCFITGADGWIEVEPSYALSQNERSVVSEYASAVARDHLATIARNDNVKHLTPSAAFGVEAIRTDDYVAVARRATPFDQLSFQLGSDAPQIADFDPGLHLDEEHADAFAPGAPVLKVIVPGRSAGWGDAAARSPTLTVSVTGSRDLSLRNADGPVDVRSPFALFGAQPGAQPWFAISAGRGLGQALASLRVYLTWEEAHNASISPGGARKYSGGFGESLTLQQAIGLASGWHPVGAPELSLKPVNTPESTIDAGAVVLPTGEPTGEIRFTLDRSLGHQEYLRAYAQAMINVAKGVPGATLPLPPFPARVTEVSIDIKTEAITPTLYHLHPFGFEEVHRGAVADPRERLLPPQPQSGALYLGIADWRPPERLTLLVEIAPGSSDPTVAAAGLHWSYLVDDAWTDADITVDDGTDALRQTGIVRLDVPAAANLQHTSFDDGLHWLRVAVRGEPAGLNRVVSVRAQAGAVRFVDHDNDPAFLATPLAAGTIAKPVEPLPALKSVEQPTAAFGGRGPETEPAFRQRVSERLRHKDRAVQVWDYERLVLAAFPDVSRVKCLNHTDGRNGQRAGFVTVVCLPVLVADAPDPLRPYVRRQTLLEVERFLRARLSPFVQLAVVQPQLEEVQLAFKVGFRQNLGNPDFYLARIQQDLIRELSPWAFGGEDVAFGGRWYKADLVDFLDELGYVDYVTDVKLIHTYPEGTARRRVEVETVAASTPGSVLVSAKRHDIRLITATARATVGMTPAP